MAGGLGSEGREAVGCVNVGLLSGRLFLGGWLSIRWSLSWILVLVSVLVEDVIDLFLHVLLELLQELHGGR